MNTHNLQAALESEAFKSAMSFFKGPEGMAFGAGKTVGNGIQGWAPGALFIKTDGTAGSRVHLNQGTSTTATWNDIADAGILDTGSFITATTVEGALQEAFQHIQSVQAFLNIPILSWQEADGTAIADFINAAAVIPGYGVEAEACGIRWNNHANPDPISTSIPIPPDLDASKDVIMHFMAYKVGATVGDAVTWTVTAFNNPDAALFDADADFGGASSAMTGDATSKTVQHETLTLANANIAAAPCMLTLTVQPTDGTLGTDDVVLIGTWLQYGRKTLTS